MPRRERGLIQILGLVSCPGEFAAWIDNGVVDEPELAIETRLGPDGLAWFGHAMATVARPRTVKEA